jgi:hypothetical protein
MNEEKMRLPGLERVKIFQGCIPRLMEIADPFPDLFEKLTKDELVKLMEAIMKYQIKLVDVEMARLKALAEALGEMQKIISNFR